MSLAAGELNRALRIDALNGTVDDLNMPVVGEGKWSVFIPLVWANPKGSTGMGVIKASSEIGTQVNAYSFRIRHNRTITRDMRVVEIDTDDKYNIIDIKHDKERREWTDLVCQIGASDG